MKNTIIVDNSPHSYIFQPFNAVPIRNFIDDMTERVRPATAPPPRPTPCPPILPGEGAVWPSSSRASADALSRLHAQDLLELSPKLLSLADEDDVAVKIRQTYLSNVQPIYGRPPSTGPGSPKPGR